MNMPMPLPLPLQLSHPLRLDALPVLRRALLCCMAAFIGTLLLWSLSAIWHSEAETERNDARASVQTTVAQLSEAHEIRLARATRAKRFALVKAVLENSPPEKTEQVTEQLSAHPHIAEPVLTAQPGQSAFPTPEHLPAVTLQHVHIEAGLLHEESLLALDAIVTNSPAHVISTGCSLQREANAAPVTLRTRCEFDRVSLARAPGSM